MARSAESAIFWRACTWINNRELQLDFGPRVHEGPIRRRNIGRQNFSRDAAHRKVEANLIANITSHSDAVTGFAVSPDHMFFVSASDDKTVKVWDTARCRAQRYQQTEAYVWTASRKGQVCVHLGGSPLFCQRCG